MLEPNFLNGRFALRETVITVLNISLPQTLRNNSCSGDGEIEAIRHLSLPWEGWMWHPERERVYSQDDVSRFLKLFQ